jgi:hypothetical protein
VGKTALVGALGDAAEHAGAETVRVDARALDASPEAFRGAVGDLTGPARRVALLDTYELLTPLDGWLRTELLPEVPSDALLVIAGRQPPGAEWTADPGWRDLLRVVSLRNLPPADARGPCAPPASSELARPGDDPLRHRLVEVDRRVLIEVDLPGGTSFDDVGGPGRADDVRLGCVVHPRGCTHGSRRRRCR